MHGGVAIRTFPRDLNTKEMKDISYRGDDYKVVENPLGRVSCDSCVFYKTHSNFGGYNPSCRVKLDMDYYKGFGYNTNEQSTMFSKCAIGVMVFESNKKFKRRVLTCVG
jgi:hypothetical protein